MKRAPPLAVAAVAAGLMVSAPFGAAAFPEYIGSRALGMGGAGRGDARGDEGPVLNPAGMSLSRVYTLDGAYQFITRDGGHFVRASVVDSTSSFNLAGGLSYTYRTASPAGASRLSGHEVGLALSYPFGDRVLVGVNGKYVHVVGDSREANGVANHSGFTLDAGVVVRPASMLTIGIVGYNLRDLSTVNAPVAIGYGIALSPIADLVIAVDGLHDLTTSDPTIGTRTTVGGGVEYMFQQKLVLRVGGGRDGGSRHGYLTAGFAGVSELGAIDIGLRQDISGDAKLTLFAVGLRLFVPQP
jgi:hypothetical protein